MIGIICVLAICILLIKIILRKDPLNQLLNLIQVVITLNVFLFCELERETLSSFLPFLLLINITVFLLIIRTKEMVMEKRS